MEYDNKKIGADIVVIDFPLLDTREKANHLTGKFISDVALQILSYVAQIERENTLDRQKEGVLEAKKRGVKFGRPKLEKPDNFFEVKELWKNRKISLRKGGELLNVSHSKFYDWIKEDS